MTKLLLLLSYSFILLSQDKESRVLEELSSHKEIIIQSANHFNISPRVVATVIYTERLLNYHFDDAILDNVLAQSGYNSSVGFGQIKLNTAFWIEEELNNPAGEYYLGKDIAMRFKRSRSRNELTERLVNDSTNIFYCAAYIAMIKKRWNKEFLFRSENEAGILATLYSLGVMTSNGLERVPHSNPQMNTFGKTAQRFFDSFELKKEFE